MRRCDYCSLSSAIEYDWRQHLARMLQIDGALMQSRVNPETGAWEPVVDRDGNRPAPLTAEERSSLDGMRRDEVIRGNALYDAHRLAERLNKTHRC